MQAHRTAGSNGHIEIRAETGGDIHTTKWNNNPLTNKTIKLETREGDICRRTSSCFVWRKFH